MSSTYIITHFLEKKNICSRISTIYSDRAIIKIEYIYLVLPACICKWLISDSFISWIKLFEVVIVVLLLLMSSYITKHVGRADIMMLITTLLLYGTYKSLCILSLSLVLVSIYGCFYIVIKNLRFSSSLPFVPFLWISCGVVFILG